MAPAVAVLLLLGLSPAQAAVVNGKAPPNAVVWASPVIEDAALSGRSYEMHNVHRSFVPEVLVVPPGSTVRFSNDDPFFHSIYSTSQPDAFDLGFYSIGPGKSVTFDRPGANLIRCHIHHAMRAVVIVTNGPSARADAKTGAFRLTIGSGSYAIHSIDIATGGEAVTRVTVGAAQTLTLLAPLGGT